MGHHSGFRTHPRVVLSETGPDHLHVIAEEVSRVAELCIVQGNPTLNSYETGWGLCGYYDGCASDSQPTAA